MPLPALRVFYRSPFGKRFLHRHQDRLGFAGGAFKTSGLPILPNAIAASRRISEYSSVRHLIKAGITLSSAISCRVRAVNLRTCQCSSSKALAKLGIASASLCKASDRAALPPSYLPIWVIRQSPTE